MLEQNMAVHQTGVSLRSIPAGEKWLEIKKNDI